MRTSKQIDSKKLPKKDFMNLKIQSHDIFKVQQN